MFKDLLGIASDLGKVVLAPVVVTASVARAVTKPVADTVMDGVKVIQKELK